MNKEAHNSSFFDRDIIVRYLDGYASENERLMLDTWVKASPQNEKELHDIKELWSMSESSAVIESIDVEAGWQLFNDQLKNPHSTSTIKLFPKWTYGLAAGIALFIAAFFVLNNYGTTPDSIQPMNLADGTKVWLNSNSSLDAPKQFTGTKRVVILTGEAFFDVARDANKPFIIKTDNSEVTVLGTSFNVKSDKQSTDVVVKTGKVQLTNTKRQDVSPILLLPEDKGIANLDGLIKAKNDDPNYLSWKTGVFKFVDTPVRQVIKNLSSYYKKPIVIPGNLSVDCNITANYQSENIVSILKSMEGPCGLRLEIYKDKFVLKK